jgi:hypothetical protein
MQFSAGNVISRAFGVTTKNFLTFFIIALIVMGPILVLEHLIGTGDAEVTYQDIEIGGQTHRLPATVEVSRTKQILSQLLHLVGQGILGGALAFGVFQSLRGGSVSVGECISRGFSRLMPIILVSIVVGICTVLGMILLIVPGVMIACAWYVCVPVTTVEKVGVGDSLSRSAFLTRGHRWSIFGMFILIVLLMMLVMLVLGGIFISLGAVPGAIAMGIVMIFISLFGGTLSAVCYHDLRVVKEGVSTEDLVKVFG